VAKALANDLPKAHILVFKMTPMKGFCLTEILADGTGDTTSGDAFALMSRW